jgi:tRNA threonylcarbamoyladenosine biosynthesis protein TsaB
MLILGLDTSSPVCAIALCEGEHVLYEDARETGQRHAEELLPRIVTALQSTQLELGKLALIAVGIGPGSFTGLRVGLATAKGLALGTGIPLRGVSSLQALAYRVSQPGEHVITMIDAGKGEVCAAVFRDALEVLPAVLASPEQAAQHVAELGLPRAILCGSGARLYPSVLLPILGPGVAIAGPETDYPSGASVARLGHGQWLAQGGSDLAALEPIYVRGSDAKLPSEPLAT